MTEYEKTILRLWFTGIKGVGIKTQKRLLSFLGDEAGIYNASYQELAKVVPSEKAEKIAGNKSLAGAKKLYERYAERNIKIIYPGHEYYPEKLLHIYDYPEILFVKGNPECMKATGIAVSRFERVLLSMQLRQSFNMPHGSEIDLSRLLMFESMAALTSLPTRSTSSTVAELS